MCVSHVVLLDRSEKASLRLGLSELSANASVNLYAKLLFLAVLKRVDAESRRGFVDTVSCVRRGPAITTSACMIRSTSESPPSRVC